MVTASKAKRGTILGSMNGPAVPAATVSDPATAPVAPFDWSSLPASEVAVYTRNTPAKDYEALTPVPVKERVTAGFEATAKAGGKAVWFVQACGTPERAEEFVKLARRYATFRGYTLRGTPNPKALSEVRYCVKVREVRKAK